MTTPTAWLDAIAGLLRAVAWPLLVGIVIFAFRKQLKGVLEKLSKVRFGGFEAEFNKTASGVKDSIVETAAGEARGESPPHGQMLLQEFYAKRAEENPANAVLEAYIVLEQWFTQTLKNYDIEVYDGTRKLSVPEMSRLAVKRGLLPESTVNAVDGLSVLRNLVAHRTDEATTEQAREFLVLSDAVMFSLKTGLTRHHPGAQH